METLTRATVTQKDRGLQVNKINCSTNGISPKMRWNRGTEEKSTSRLKNVTMLALSYPVLDMSPRTG